ncbi:MAG TPA: DUF1129 domain-containing protein [Propionibacterium sp.]|nr:DUF1129 domain-containing protein [Propionibacterium sp.]
MTPVRPSRRRLRGHHAFGDSSPQGVEVCASAEINLNDVSHFGTELSAKFGSMLPALVNSGARLVFAFVSFVTIVTAVTMIPATAVPVQSWWVIAIICFVGVFSGSAHPECRRVRERAWSK